MQRVVRALSRRIFYVCNVKKFKYFVYTATIESPSRLEGKEFIKMGAYAYVQSNAWLLGVKQDEMTPLLDIQEGATIGRFSHIVAVHKVVIEKNVLIAEKVYISDNLHSYEDITIPILRQAIIHKGDVVIGENSWIGESVSIIGASVGKHSIIGANSVVTEDIPPYSVAVGSPAKVIKRYNFSTNIWEKVS